MATASQVLASPADATIERATFVLDSGAGAFTVADTTSDLLNVQVESNIGTYTLDQTGSGSERTYTVTLEGKRRGWRLGRTTNQVTARLNTAPVWDLEMNIGAAKLTCDLTPFKVERLEINGGASS